MQESFFGKLLLHVVVFAILLIRSTDDIAKYKNLFDEATFYDKQWNATWEGQVPRRALPFDPRAGNLL